MHTSNHQLKHVESSRQTYLECIFDDVEHNGEKSDSKHIKSIVRTDAYQHPSESCVQGSVLAAAVWDRTRREFGTDFCAAVNPHKFDLKEGFVTVGEHGDVVSHYAYRRKSSHFLTLYTQARPVPEL